MRFIFLATACLATPLAAQTPAPPVAEAASPADPERLAAAERVANRILPPGSYAKLMESVLGGDMMNQMLGGMGDMDMGAMVGSMGEAMGEEVAAEAKAELEGMTLRELMTAQDPHWEERQRIQMRVMTDAMKPIMSRLEPAMRTGLASAYAKRFSLPQLQEYERFFATPAGTAFAESSLSIWVDPEVMKSSMAMMPELMKEMPAIMVKMQAATAHLPPPPKTEASDEKVEDEADPVA